MGEWSLLSGRLRRVGGHLDGWAWELELTGFLRQGSQSTIWRGWDDASVLHIRIGTVSQTLTLSMAAACDGDGPRGRPARRGESGSELVAIFGSRTLAVLDITGALCWCHKGRRGQI